MVEEGFFVEDFMSNASSVIVPSLHQSFLPKREMEETCGIRNKMKSIVFVWDYYQWTFTCWLEAYP